MELKESVKEQFVDGRTFLNYLNGTKSIISHGEVDINDLDFLDGFKLVRDNPRVIKLKEIFEPKILNKISSKLKMILNAVISTTHSLTLTMERNLYTNFFYLIAI